MLGTTFATLGIAVTQKVTLIAAFAFLTKLLGIAALGAAGSVALMYGLPLAILILCMLKFMASEPAQSFPEAQPKPWTEEQLKAAQAICDNSEEVILSLEARVAKELFVPPQPTEGLQSCIQPPTKKNIHIRLALTDEQTPLKKHELQGARPHELSDPERTEYLTRQEEAEKTLCLEQISNYISAGFSHNTEAQEYIMRQLSKGLLNDLYEIKNGLARGSITPDRVLAILQEQERLNVHQENTVI